MANDVTLPLAPRDLLILAVLAEGPLHGYGIIKAVEARSESGVLLDPANLYRVLRRMRRLEWIQESAEAKTERAGIEKVGAGMEKESAGSERESAGIEKESGARGGQRRVYEVTALGRSLLSAELARLERLLRQAQPALGGG